MNEVVVGLIAMAVLLLLFLTGIELAFCMAIMGFVGFAYLVAMPAAFNLLAKDFFDSLASYGFTVIPLFIFMGQIAFNSGIAKKLFEAANRFIGHIPGGLAIATVVGATIFKAICGSSPATAATFASVAVPEMDRFGYDKRLSTGIVATVGTLGILIPPSVTLIVFGVITEQSIGRLFMAGLVPGLMISLCFMVIIVGWAKMNPAIAPRAEKSTWPARFASLPDVAWPVIIFCVVIGGLLKGFFTPSEAGSIGCSAVIVLALLKRALGWKEFIKSVDESLRHRLHGHHAHSRLRCSGPFYRRDQYSHARRRVDCGFASAALDHHDHHINFLPAWWFVYRRSGLHDPRNADILSRYHKTRVRPHVVRYDHRHNSYGWSGYSSGGHQCVCCKEYYQDAVQRDLCGGVPVPVVSSFRRNSVVHLPFDLHIPSEPFV